MNGNSWNVWFIYVLIWVKMWSRILWVGVQICIFLFSELCLVCDWDSFFFNAVIWQFSWIFTSFTVLLYLIFPLSGFMYTFKSFHYKILVSVVPVLYILMIVFWFLVKYISDWRPRTWCSVRLQMFPWWSALCMYRLSWTSFNFWFWVQ